MQIRKASHAVSLHVAAEWLQMHRTISTYMKNASGGWCYHPFGYRDNLEVVQ